MVRPQQEELARSERTPVDPDSFQTEEAVEGGLRRKGKRAPVPEENRQGHHPEREQDKPEALGGAGHGKKRRSEDE